MRPKPDKMTGTALVIPQNKWRDCCTVIIVSRQKMGRPSLVVRPPLVVRPSLVVRPPGDHRK